MVEVAITWALIASLAQDAGARCPNLVAAQWALESGWGEHVSGKNNPFGIKGKGVALNTVEWNGSRYVSEKAEFKNYPSLEASVQELVDRWYKDYRGYKGVNNASNCQEAARELQRQGYATAPDYADKLIQLMNRNS
jgi:flagellum-specific peptidoglycan hydrolase FlgJ